VTAVPHPSEIDVEHPLERLSIRLLDDRRRMADARVVHEHIETVFVGGGLDELFERLGVAHVEFVKARIATRRLDSLDSLRAAIGVDIGHHDPRTLLGTPLGGGAADTGPRTRDEHRPVVQLHGEMLAGGGDKIDPHNPTTPPKERTPSPSIARYGIPPA
jgi:hypothetical protein